MKSFTKIAASVFAILGIVCIPFPLHLFPFHEKVIKLLFGNLIISIRTHVLQDLKVDQEISSDSVNLYILICILLTTTVLITMAILAYKKRKEIQDILYEFSTIILSYYLSFQLLNYGFNKIFKSQFYLPEPNTLYTPVGYLDKDILFWTTMGSSYSYNLFLGGIEVFAGLLLLFRKTRMIGCVLSITIFANILAINISFDISVKLFVTFLLFLSLFGCSRYFLGIIKKLIQSLKNQYTPWYTKKTFIYPFMKSFIILCMVYEVLYPNIMTNTFHDDKIDRPFLHGAYEVINTTDNGIHAPYNPWKRIFMHRENYIIFQDEKDQMTDFKLQINPSKSQIKLTDYDLTQMVISYHYIKKDSILVLRYNEQGHQYQLTTKQLNWKTLPLLKNQFHWIIEDVE
ncbi:hypothetical protein GCM10022393_29360 [Aquimarina addita]|uniref:DoxX family protein n=1 Tax=Aquimarina addita TaxID=870485 RepID=A0ABP6UQN8_9FLAO